MYHEIRDNPLIIMTQRLGTDQANTLQLKYWVYKRENKSVAKRYRHQLYILVSSVPF